MSPYKVPVVVLIALLLSTSCSNQLSKPDNGFELTVKTQEKHPLVGAPIGIEVTNNKQLAVDSVAYFIDGSRLQGSKDLSAANITIKDGRVGERLITAKIYSAGKTYSASNTVVAYANQVPKLYNYTITQTFPHDMQAFTQGIEFAGDTLYESTGKLKQSSLRKIDFTSGTVVERVNLDDRIFGEGLTVMNGKVYQLTWKARRGFVYNAQTLAVEKTFYYNKSKEGWGLCNDGNTIYKSDGTHRIWKLNPETLEEEDYIEIYTNTSKIDNINELEFVDGKIYANVWQKDAIAIINPQTGAVEGVINTKTLKDNVTQHKDLDVLNGIAYKGEPGFLYLTGKNWDKLFKVQIQEK